MQGHGPIEETKDYIDETIAHVGQVFKYKKIIGEGGFSIAYLYEDAKGKKIVVKAPRNNEQSRNFILRDHENHKELKGRDLNCISKIFGLGKFSNNINYIKVDFL